jgi:hypothetical protein
MNTDFDTHLIRFVAAMNVARTGLDHSKFCKDLTPEKARKKLAKTGHTLCEYMQGKGTFTKLYLDRDVRLAPGQVPTKQLIETEERAVRNNVEALLLMLETDDTDLSYNLAIRHGVPNPNATPGSKDACHKLSFRPFVSGLKIRYCEIPAIIYCAEQELFWDMTVYKPSEQLLAAIGGCKGNTRDGFRDERLLLPSEDTDLLDYVAQHLEPHWLTLDLSSEFVQQQTEAAAERRAHLNAQPTSMSAPSSCKLFVEALVNCLSQKTASDRQKWLKVAMALRNEAAAGTDDETRALLDEAYFTAWLAFSKKSIDKFQGETDCRKTWDSIKQRQLKKVTIGSICLMASEDDIDAYNKAQALNYGQFTKLNNSKKQGDNRDDRDDRDDRDNRDNRVNRVNGEGAGAGADKEERMKTLLSQLWPEHFEGRMNTFHMGDQQGGVGMKTVPFSYDVRGVRGEVMQDYFVQLTMPSGEVLHLGSLSNDKVSVNNLWRINNTLDPDAEYVYSRSAQKDGATLKRSDARDDDPFVHMQRPFTKDQTMCVRSNGKKPQNVTSKLANQVFMDVVSKSQECVERRHGLTLFQVNNYNLNVNISGNNTDNGLRTDSELSKAWVTFIKGLSDRDEMGNYRVVYTGDIYYLFDSDEGTWYKNKNMDLMVNKMREGMERIEGGAFMTSLDEGEKRYIRGIRGGSSVFRCLLNDILDRHFEKRLDANKDLLPFDNGVYNLRTCMFRALRWDDYVTTTIGYQYEAETSPDHVTLVDSFFEQVFPFSDERELFLRMAGSALCGIPMDKKFVVMQDYRGGDNGKSMVIKTIESAFGSFCMPSQPAFLCASSHNNPNGHEANTLAYKGKRLAIFDETDPKMKFDLAKLKSITGGAPRMAVRGAGAATVTEFRWSAFIMIACNKGCLPEVDSTDTAFMNRLIPLPMRAKFYDELHGEREPYSYPKDADMEGKLRGARMAVMLSLLGGLARHKASDSKFDRLPAGCVELRQAIAIDSDPVCELVEGLIDRHIEFGTTDRNDEGKGRKAILYVTRKDLLSVLKDNDTERKLKGVKSSAIKDHVDAVMARHGRTLILDTFVGGERFVNAYKDCKLIYL